MDVDQRLRPAGQSTGLATALWLVLGSLLVVGAIAFQSEAPEFLIGPGLAAAPIWSLVAAMSAAGVGYALALPWLVNRTVREGPGSERVALLIVLLSGLAARVLLLPGPVMLDDDVYRYLWDGAVVAHGHNPYLQSPGDALSNPRTAELGSLAKAAEGTLRVLNHPDLTTVYPPVAQVFFAGAYLLSPLSLTAWRVVVLGLDLVLLLGLVALARDTGRSALWVALYWWHPIALKELSHAGHMEAVLLPLVVWSVVLAGRGRLGLAVALLGAATATKFWPALLLPLLLRPELRQGLWPTRQALGLAVLYGGVTLAALAPMLLTPYRELSGISAYAVYWSTNSALFPAFETLVRLSLQPFATPEQAPALVARGLIAAALGALAIAISRRPIGSPDDLAGRIAFVVAAVVLLSPSQFPWYTLWFAPFLVVRPYPAMLAIVVTMPLYYGSFSPAVRFGEGFLSWGLVWLIWLPVLLVLALSIPRLRTKLGVL